MATTFAHGQRVRFNPTLTTREFNRNPLGVNSTMQRLFDDREIMVVVGITSEGNVEANKAGDDDAGTWTYPVDFFVLAEETRTGEAFAVRFPSKTEEAIRPVIVLLRALGFSMESCDDTMVRWLVNEYDFLLVRPTTAKPYAWTTFSNEEGYSVVGPDLRSVAEAATALLPVAPPVPEAPMRLNGYDVAYEDNGDVKVGCTTVTAAQVVLIAAKSAENAAK